MPTSRSSPPLHTPYAGLVGSHVTVLTVHRADIDAGNIAPALETLQPLIASLDALNASNGTISLLVSGYDDDPRELQTIPEVRAFFQTLDDAFPYWFHVVTRIEHTLRLLFTLLVPLTPIVHPLDPSLVSYRFDNDDLRRFLSRHMDTMDNLHAKYGFSEETSQRIGELVLNYFESLITP